MLWILLGATLTGITPAVVPSTCDPHSLCNIDVLFGLIITFISPIVGVGLVFAEKLDEESPPTLKFGLKIVAWFWIFMFWEFFVFSPGIIWPSTNDIEFWRLPAMLSFILSPFILGIILISGNMDESKS